MPIYAYKCAACGFAKDLLQKMSDPPLTECPECHKPSFSKQLTAAGFQLKGSGWYVTDFRDGGGKKPGAAADKADDKSADKPAEAGADKAAAPAPAAADSSSGAAASPAPAPAAAPPPVASS